MQKIVNKIFIIIFFFTTACAKSWEDVKKGVRWAEKNIHG